MPGQIFAQPLQRLAIRLVQDLWLVIPFVIVFDHLGGAKLLFPDPLQGTRHQALLRLDRIISAPCSFRLITHPFAPQRNIALSWTDRRVTTMLFDLSWSPDPRHLAVYRFRPGFRREVNYDDSFPTDQLQPKQQPQVACDARFNHRRCQRVLRRRRAPHLSWPDGLARCSFDIYLEGSGVVD
ncbi:hypothetical protein [Mesorhizobium sp. WSM2561]|uniref:hypothetical protein n=1 Tax=Mesorhizobium sp. WSM2561 TaxID=1040985 RepID=UPI0004831109|nr:hypothetical protein [Mesorhizobium sp. WSM2561]